MEKNQTILLLFEKKILGMEKKSNDFVTFRKKILGMEKKIKRFCYFSKKKFWVWKKFFFKNALHKLNIDQTFLLHFKKKKDDNMVRLHYSKRS